jgi:putative FmdB family regulatory protein
MPLYEFDCQKCKISFEQITRMGDPDLGRCPSCQTADSSKRRISRFWVGGQGDLRESTLHGCHDCELSPGGLTSNGASELSHGGHHDNHDHHDHHDDHKHADPHAAPSTEPNPQS